MMLDANDDANNDAIDDDDGKKSLLYLKDGKVDTKFASHGNSLWLKISDN
jgi:hypothetical protein